MAEREAPNVERQQRRRMGVAVGVAGLVLGLLVGAAAGGETKTTTETQTVVQMRTHTQAVRVVHVKTVTQVRRVVRTHTVTVKATPAADAGGYGGSYDSGAAGASYAGMTCAEIGHSFSVTPGSDPEHDADNDGIACESY
jgi:hypothetical protein